MQRLKFNYWTDGEKFFSGNPKLGFTEIKEAIEEEVKVKKKKKKAKVIEASAELYPPMEDIIYPPKVLDKEE
tara:strand:- start:709 stop:924 length:216 start_codon:yes stop_codon:yes gene_type:complete